MIYFNDKYVYIYILSGFIKPVTNEFCLLRSFYPSFRIDVVHPIINNLLGMNGKRIRGGLSDGIRPTGHGHGQGDQHEPP